ncbi:glycosyltransferase [Leptothermofonsia sichuanensis E412]|uniref:glycosyltransferase n=1 Tax=Leptothermofonsia sichuanensis TaxID=2917832 RepID=UPI001CA75F4A|nr:glycosyltransferase [Leptothermofonsia sichuanensis]QZZ20232.1 glycosyltransferase [Leptothermofonsia sichuanensis E412]
MKVLHVIPSISPIMGGPPQVALNLVWALRNLGVEAEIATTNFNGSEPMDVPLNQRVKYPIAPNEKASVPVWFLPFRPPALKEFIFSPALAGWLWQHIQDYDVLDNHYLFSFAPTCAAAIARFKHVPYTVRTMGQLTPWALKQSRLKKQIYTALIERHNLNQAAAIHCTTPAEAEDIRHFGLQTPTITLPLGVTPPTLLDNAATRLRQQYNIATDVPIILFLSRIHYKKRPDLLLKSLAQLNQQGHRFHLIMAGSGEPDYLTELQTMVVALGIAQQVTFPGMVTGVAKDLLLQGSDLFVLPSYSENFGIAVAEAMISGLPVVITPGVQIAPEIAAAQAGLVVEGEWMLLAGAIAQLLTSPQLRQTMGENGRRLAKSRYSWTAIAKNLIPAYAAISLQSSSPSIKTTFE